MICIEVIEYFYVFYVEWVLFNKFVVFGGVFVIMIKCVFDKVRFVNWYYKNDVIYVSFFSEVIF